MAAKKPQENQPLKSDESDIDDENNQQQQAQDVDGERQQKHAQEYMQEAGVACNKCYNWFPLGLFGWIGGILVIVCCLIDMIVVAMTVTEFFVVALLILGGLLLIVVEMPTSIVRSQSGLSRMQLALYEWLKLLSRMWGKSIFCLLLCVMSFSEVGGGFRSLPWIAGLYFAVLIILYLVFGLLAAKKYNGLFVYISKTGSKGEAVDVNNAEMDDEHKEQAIAVVVDQAGGGKEQEVWRHAFDRKFDEIDEDHDGKIGRDEVAKVAVEANLELSNAECHAIACYLDEDCTGVIVKEEWTRMWLRNTTMIWL